jgi:hypothetical protein
MDGLTFLIMTDLLHMKNNSNIQNLNWHFGFTDLGI